MYCSIRCRFELRHILSINFAYKNNSNKAQIAKNGIHESTKEQKLRRKNLLDFLQEKSVEAHRPEHTLSKIPAESTLISFP